MTESLPNELTEAALFELLSLERRVDSDGDVYYYNALGQIHRVYGPAIEYADGTYVWQQNGLRHRLGGPAVVCPSGYRAWFQTGKRHRIDGPAIEYPSGRREWYINGIVLTEAAWQQAVASVETV